MKSPHQTFLPYALSGAWLGLLSASVAFDAAGAATGTHPNIVIILADDMGFSDIGCYGGEVQTPNLDKLAANGVRFTQFYNNARCCPTRASILTGLYPHQAGVGHMVEDRGYPGYQGFLNDRCVTIAEVLRPAGYRTYLSGKWHVGENRPHWPVDRGFDRSFSLISGASSYFQLDPGRKMALDDQPYTPPTNGFYMTDAIADHAVEFLAGHTGKPEPFFLYVAFTAPHWPLHALPAEIEKYKTTYLPGWDELRTERHRRQKEMGIVAPDWLITPRDSEAPSWQAVPDKEAQALRMAVYAAQIDRLDQGVGRILAQLQRMRAAENTLVLFLADNGGCAEKVNRGQPGALPGTRESYMSYGLPWANLSNTPFRLYKHWVHEGGIATPLIAYWPAGIPAARRGQLERQPGHIIDLLATCADLGGAKYPTECKGNPITPTPGVSLRPAFEGKALARQEPLFWEHEGNRAVRDGQWKLVSRRPGAWELYDLEADRTELHNLAASQPAKVKELIAQYEQWSKRCGVIPWNQLNPPKKASR